MNNTLGRCPHCGAPITTNIKISGRVTKCEYCKSEIVLSQDVFSTIVNYQNQQRQQEKMAKQQLANALNQKILQQEKQENEKKSKKVIAAILILFAGGCFGIPSFICKRPGLGILCIFLSIVFVNTDLFFIPAFAIPIYSIIRNKL